MVALRYISNPLLSGFILRLNRRGTQLRYGERRPRCYRRSTLRTTVLEFASEVVEIRA